MTTQSISILVAGKSLFYAGELVNAFCDFVTTNKLQLTSFDVTLYGRSKVKWTESHTYTASSGDSSRTESKTVTYDDNQQLLTTRQSVPIPNGYLLPGRSSFPFKFQLPTNLVTSFEGPEGYIRYWIEVDVPIDIFPEKIPIAVIKVLQLIDTNIPQYRFQIRGNDSKTICCGCCAEGPLVVEAKTDRASYCPEEIITLTASFENNSNRPVKPYVKLVQRKIMATAFTRAKKSKTESKVYLLSAAAGNPLDPVSERNTVAWERAQFSLPAVIPSINSALIQVNYYVEVGMVIPRVNDLKVFLPVVVGTIPYKGEVPVVDKQVAPVNEEMNNSSYFAPSTFQATPWYGKGGQAGGVIPIAIPFELPPTMNNAKNALVVNTYVGPIPDAFSNVVAEKPELD